ncbi:2-C-methyl-D-erythritol 4-phosphate cytidylyltransferase [bacterium]|nr:2-C-methyl-D-erythritol 4-phosphate cytidylyltransferase [bacterium]
MSYALLIPAAGKGERFGGELPKALTPVNGKPLIWWSLKCFVQDSRLEEVSIAAPDEYISAIAESVGDFVEIVRISVISGGLTRQDSVGQALFNLKSGADNVLVHDAARPAISRDVIDRVVEGLDHNVAVVPGLPVTDTVKRVDKNLTVRETLNREVLFAVQTPQGIRLREFQRAHRMAKEHQIQCTDDAALIEYFQLGSVKVVFGDPQNIKLTLPHDLPRVETFLRDIPSN